MPYLAPTRLAEQLEARGLCSIVEDTVEPPKPDAGVSPSASPAVPVSPQTTASEPKSGGRRGRPQKEA